MGKTRRRRSTKIVATIGPASREPKVLRNLIEAGVDVCRINCSHSTHEMIRAEVANIRRQASATGRPVSILLDLQGPKIRTGPINPALVLTVGDELEVRADDTLGGLHLAPGRFACGTTYAALAHDVVPGDTVLFADGALGGVVVSSDTTADPPSSTIRITQGGSLGAHKGINLPGVEISAASLTPKDRADLEVGAAAGVDYVALSFVRQAQDVLELKELLRTLGHPDMPVVAKIEKPEALHNFQEILTTVDGIMVARGDLGVEVALETVPIHQKRLLQAANAAGVLAITATQMLDSMERNARPTRAETTDVANAILDGTDAVMLSGETAVGDHPLEAVAVMGRIATEVERSPWFGPPGPDELPLSAGPSQTVIRAACLAAAETGRPLVVFTSSGHSAIQVSKYRPKNGVFALTPTATVRDRLAMAWGVTPLQIPIVRTTDDLIAVGEAALMNGGYLNRGDEVVVLVGSSLAKGATDMMKVHSLGT
jgi:pyruvate kinase